MKRTYLSLLHPLLMLSAPSQATEALVADCERCGDLWILRVEKLAAALRVLRTSRVSVAVVGPEVCEGDVSTLLAAIAEWQPKVPTLVLRRPLGRRLDAWKSQTVAVLDFPTTPGLLPKAVETALGLRRIRARAN
jgi:hypothetical protein